MKKINHDVKPGKLGHCQITGSKNLFEAIDLGFQPPCSALRTEITLREPETYYPLRLMICPESGLGSSTTSWTGQYSFLPTIHTGPAYPFRSAITSS